MDKCREEFEKIPYVKAILEGVHSSIVWFGEDKYHTSFVGFDGAVNRLNGAWFVFQHQQAKVEELQQDLEAQREETIKGYTKISDLRLERYELQKRVDKALELCKKGGALSACLAFRVEQALKGEG
ncbi:TPA: hypothetical protein ACNICG_002797 [Acinetobacter baumannii]